MSKTAEPPSSKAINYKKAEGVEVRAVASTAACSQDVRTVSTRKTSGLVALRYAPREPKVGMGETSTM